MRILNRLIGSLVAVTAFAALAAPAAVQAQLLNSRESREARTAETPREAATHPTPRTHPAPQQPARAPNSRTPPLATSRTTPPDPRVVAVHSQFDRRMADGSVVRETRLAGGGSVREVSRVSATGQVRVVRYGVGVSGIYERTIRPGLVSRTYVGGSHVQYTRVYQQHVWHQYGQSFAYDAYVPAIHFPTAYFAWAVVAWPRPVIFTWGWQAQPWYPAYGAYFTPYPVYASPDEWMTDYVIADSMQSAYQTQTGAPPSDPSYAGTPVAEPADAGAAPGSDASPDGGSGSPQAADGAPPEQAGDAAAAAAPPVVTPDIKAQLDTQIKVQLQEQQAASATPVSLVTSDGPAALRPNHVFFEVVQPIDVPAASPDHYCSLNANDYIKRIGDMSPDDWKVPVIVELSRPTDCPEGLQTRIGLNDLNAMENEQEARVLEAMQAASKSMGPNGPPSGPGSHPTLIADGNAAPDPQALDAIRQLQ